MSTHTATSYTLSQLQSAAKAAFEFEAGSSQRPGMDQATAEQAVRDLIDSEDDGFFDSVKISDYAPGIFTVQVVFSELLSIETFTPAETAAAVLIAREIVS